MAKLPSAFEREYGKSSTRSPGPRKTMLSENRKGNEESGIKSLNPTYLGRI